MPTIGYDAEPGAFENYTAVDVILASETKYAKVLKALDAIPRA